MKTVLIFAVLALFCLPGCSTPGSEYARAHPELSAAHRDILIHGVVRGGLAVEGMTKQQVRLAAGNPTAVEKFDRGDVWVYSHQSFVEREGGGEERSLGSQGGGSSSKPGITTGRQMMVEKTMIFFEGDRATHAQISKERE